MTIKPVKLDWGCLLQDLKEQGVSLYQVAKIIGRSESTVQSWRKGHEPSHSHGEALIELHIKTFGLAATDRRLDELRARACTDISS